VLSLEDHALPGGFGAALGEAMADHDIVLPLSRGGVRDELVPHASRDQQLAAHGLDKAGVMKRIKDLLALAEGAVIRFPRTGSSG
jgi:1-deoxy-D-xylulose-5-phosphate synthase